MKKEIIEIVKNNSKLGCWEEKENKINIFKLSEKLNLKGKALRNIVENEASYLLNIIREKDFYKNYVIIDVKNNSSNELIEALKEEEACQILRKIYGVMCIPNTKYDLRDFLFRKQNYNMQ